MRFILSIIIVLSLQSAYAQDGFLRMYGRVEEGSTVLKDVTIEVIKDNKMIKEFKNNVKGAYEISFDLGSIYNVKFLKEGYVTKSIDVIAMTPDLSMSGNYFFQLDIDLFRLGENPEDEEEVLLPSVAKIYLKDAKEGFIYDQKYVRWISDEYDELKEEE